MPRRFSRAFPTYEAWAEAHVRAPAHARASEYTQRIARTHARYPTATLSQLRRHPGGGRSPLSGVPQAPLSRLPVAYLSRKEALTRRRALEIVSEARRGKGSLSKLARAKGIAPRTIRRASGAFRKRGGRWVATRTDRVERWLKTYEGGYRAEVLVRDSRTATLLSKYANAVAHYLETGDARAFKEFDGKTYVDAAGTTHSFETNPDAIRAAIERSESDFGAFVDLYVEKGEVEEAD